MSANVQGSSARWDNLNGITIDTQALSAFWLLKAHYRPDVIGSGSTQGVCNMSTTTTDSRSNDTVQLQLLNTGFPRWRQSSSPTAADMTAGSAFVANTWKSMGVAFPAFDGTSQTIRMFNGTTSEDIVVSNMNTYAGNFLSFGVGDGSFSTGDGRIAYVALYPVASLAAATTIYDQLVNNAPSTVGTPTLDYDFLTAAPAGFTALSGASIDAAENPTLSGGGGGGIVQTTVVIV